MSQLKSDVGILKPQLRNLTHKALLYVDGYWLDGDGVYRFFESLDEGLNVPLGDLVEAVCCALLAGDREAPVPDGANLGVQL